MSCYHPLKGWKIGYHSSGKPEYKITGYDVQALKKMENGSWTPVYELLKTDFSYPLIRDSIDIPCGHCIGCYLTRSRQWADRCMLECSYHDFNSFVTLTIDDEHLQTKKVIAHDDLVWNPLENYICDTQSGQLLDSPLKTLRKSDLQKFLKRLRKKFPDVKIRFFGCGEYGTESLRPHYHLILFGVDFHEDRVLYKKNFRGENLYNSPTLSALWPFGYAVIADVTWNSCAYVSRYCLKKRSNDLTDLYDSFDLAPEFVNMSRKPGIARQYYEDHKIDIYKNEEIFLSDVNGVKKIYPPKYFDKLYDVDYPSDFEDIRLHRQEKQKISKQLILDKTDLDYLDYLKVCEYNKNRRTALLNERSGFYESSV